MSMNLETLRARVAQDLDDPDGAIWSAEELDRAVQRALAEYSAGLPSRREAVITLSQEGREVDLTGIAGLMDVERIWYPYTPDTWPPRWCRFEQAGPAAVRLKCRETPQAGESLLIFYWAAHTLAGLEGAEETSVPHYDMDILAAGAGAYAALEKSRRAVGAINVSGYTPLQWAEWAGERLRAFREALHKRQTSSGVVEGGPIVMGLSRGG